MWWWAGYWAWKGEPRISYILAPYNSTTGTVFSHPHLPPAPRSTNPHRSLDESLVFDPTDLAEDVTPAAALRALGRGAHLRALLMALRLNDPQLVQHVVLRWVREGGVGLGGWQRQRWWLGGRLLKAGC